MTRLIRLLRRVPVGLWLYWGFLLVLVYLFALLAEQVIWNDPIGFDPVVLIALDRWKSPGLDLAARVLDVVGGSYFLLPATVLASIVMWHRRPRTALFFGLAVLGAIALNGLAKLYFARARPDRFDALVPAEGYAFPSGHTMSSTAIALAVFFVVRAYAPEWRWPALALGAAFALAVGVSRSYLQVHYPSDVVAGWILATAWVLGVYAWYSVGGGRSRASPGTSPTSGASEAETVDTRP